MKSIIEYTDSHYIKIIDSENRFDAIRDLAMGFDGRGVCCDINGLIDALIERERMMSTGIGSGIAIPHVKIAGVNDISFAVGVSRGGIDFDSIDGNPVNLIILTAAGEKQQREYLMLLSEIMKILKMDDVRENIIMSGSAEEIYDIISCCSVRR
jgi:mannitol/fructose-specific phosphotransferase system IIA component (Ntr-type)